MKFAYRRGRPVPFHALFWSSVIISSLVSRWLIPDPYHHWSAQMGEWAAWISGIELIIMTVVWVKFGPRLIIQRSAPARKS